MKTLIEPGKVIPPEKQREDDLIAMALRSLAADVTADDPYYARLALASLNELGPGDDPSPDELDDMRERLGAKLNALADRYEP